MDLTVKNISTADVSDTLGIAPPSVHRLVRDGFLEVKGTKRYKTGEELYFDHIIYYRFGRKNPTIPRHVTKQKTI